MPPKKTPEEEDLRQQLEDEVQKFYWHSRHRRKKRTCLQRFWRLIKAFSFLLLVSVIGLSLYGRVMYAPGASGWGSFVEDFERGMDCGKCRSAIMALKAMAKVGDEQLKDFLIMMCTKRDVPEHICEGVIPGQASVLGPLFRNMSVWGEGAARVCADALKICDERPIPDWTPPMSPPPAVPKKWVSRGRTPFRVIHHSDLHIDYSYQEGSEADCLEPICCRKESRSKTPDGRIARPAGKFGDQRCDTPPALYETMLASMREHEPEALFTLQTGDILDHFSWDMDAEDVRHTVREVSQAWQGTTFNALGNHDTVPINTFPPPWLMQDTRYSNAWLYEEAAMSWNGSLDDAATASLRDNAGSYSYLVPDTSLRIVVLNTMYWTQGNYWLYPADDDHPDFTGLITWLSNQLGAAEMNGERVWIIGHVPFGRSDNFAASSHYLDDLVQRYSSTIAALFFGHSHYDEFQLSFSDYDRPSADTATSVAFIAGAATCNGGNPSWRAYSVDPDTYEVLDYTVCYADILAPIDPAVGPPWVHYYTAKEAYGSLVSPPLVPSDPLSPSFWFKLVEAFERDDAAFQAFWKRLSAHHPLEHTHCDENGKRDLLAHLRAMRSENNGDDQGMGIAFGRHRRRRRRSETNWSMYPSVRKCDNH